MREVWDCRSFEEIICKFSMGCQSWSKWPICSSNKNVAEMEEIYSAIICNATKFWTNLQSTNKSFVFPYSPSIIGPKTQKLCSHYKKQLALVFSIINQSTARLVLIQFTLSKSKHLAKCLKAFPSNRKAFPIQNSCKLDSLGFQGSSENISI